jgi:hypothetical protein
MATRGRPLPAAKVQQIRKLTESLSIRKAAKVAGVARNSVRKYTKQVGLVV